MISFPAWRRFTAARVEANDAMMALLVAARIGEHALGNSAAAPHAHLTDVYGAISGIGRLNVTVARGGQLMGAAERHLAFMAIPFCLAVHDELMQSVVQMLRDGGVDYDDPRWKNKYNKKPSSIGIAAVHAYVAERTDIAFDATDLEMFRLANRIRNRIIHYAGVANAALIDEYKQGWSGGVVGWEQLTGRSLIIDGDGVLEVGEPELVASLAISKRLAEQVNIMLRPPVLSRTYWAGVVVEDYRQVNKQRFGQKHHRGRRLAGYARHAYRDLQLTEQELVAEANARYP